MPDAEPGYWAFLSYSHADLGCARRLHRALEGFAVPHRLVGRPTPAGPAPRRFQPIFRDREELGASADLGGRLIAALEASAWLIVICSPAAARSRWVNEEIVRFRALHGAERILAVIVAGEPFASEGGAHPEQECFPAALREAEHAVDRGGGRFEPAAADLRQGKDGWRLAQLKLVSGMLGVGLDHLVRRQAHHRQQQLAALLAASLAGTAAMSWLAFTAIAERNDAYAQRGQAEGLVEFMIGDLRRKLEPSGRLDALDAVGSRALTYYAAEKRHGLDAASIGRRARVLHMLGEIADRRGDTNAALTYFLQASTSTAELLTRAPNDPQRIFDHAQSVYWVGYVAWRRGQDDEAREAFQTYQRLADQLVAIDPKNQDWRAEVDDANSNLGTVLLADGQAEAAAAHFQRALDISAGLGAAPGADREEQIDLGQSYAWLADTEFMRGRLDQAGADRAAEAAIYQRLIAEDPDDRVARLDLAVNWTAQARMLLARGEAVPALAQLQAAAEVMDHLIAVAPGDASYQVAAEPTFLLLGQTLLRSGRVAQAQPVVGRALAMATAATRKDPSVLEWSGLYLGSARALAMRTEAARGASPAAQRRALAPAGSEAKRLEALSAASPRRVDLAGVAAEARLLAGDFESLGHDPGRARADWAAAMAILQRAGPPSSPSADPRQAVIAQLGYRLQVLIPPSGPITSNGHLVRASVQSPTQSRVDYDW